MKRNSTIGCLLLAMLIGAGPAKATVHIINAQGTTLPDDIFVPYITSAFVGDTITWIWIDGYHTTESVTIPAGAASWSSLLDNGTPTFSYVVTVPGTYYFDCHYESFGGHGMDGYIEVSIVGAINASESDITSDPFPNPFEDLVVYKTRDADLIRVHNILGQPVISRVLNENQEEVTIDTKSLPSGMYFFSLSREGQNVETRKLLKN